MKKNMSTSDVIAVLASIKKTFLKKEISTKIVIQNALLSDSF